MLDIQGLHIRAALFRCIREFFSERGFLEVDTPIRQPVIIPESNIEPLMSDGAYLQTSPELCMKRLLASGCDKIFQICHCFRKNERGRKHLEEFTMLEWYRTDADYHDLMNDCEDLLRFTLQYEGALYDETDLFAFRFSNNPNLGYTPDKVTVSDAFARFAPVSLQEALQKDIFDEVLVEFVEPELGKDRPLFLFDYPKELASLARVSKTNSQVAERFELYVEGLELANGFTELTDPEEQRDRFKKELATIAELSTREQQMPERFLEELINVKSAAGIAFGLDRYLMLLSGKKHIDDVIAFAPKDLE